jgi:cytochrome c-type biogenesis protein CcmH
LTSLFHRLRSLARNRAFQLLLVFSIALITVGAGDTTSASDPAAKFSSIGHKMMCVCGCGQILLECNHVGCPDSERMIGELRSQVAGGGSDTSIFNWFVAKYGPTVLAAPIRGGFDNAAWIVPVVVFLLAMLGTVFLIRRWKGRHMLAVAGAVPYSTGGDELRERIRRETEY